MKASRSLVWLGGVLALAAGWLSGCAGVRPSPAPAREIIMEPMRLEARPVPGIDLSAFDASTLLREGLRHQQEGNCQRAVAHYRRLLEDFPDSRYRSPAALNLGVCLEEMKRPDEAAVAYRLIVDGMEHSRDWPPTARRLADMLLRGGKLPEAIEVLDRYLRLPSLPTEERLDALARLAEAKIGAGRLFQAENDLRRLVALFREREKEEYLDAAPAARAEYRLGQLAEDRFTESPLRLPDEQMEQDLERKAQLLLEAQACYLRSIRLADAFWATRAGFRIGQLYLELHRAMAEAPVPADLGAEEVCVYRRLLAEKTAVLLRKALGVLEQALEIADRTGIRDDAVQAAREQMHQIEQAAVAGGAGGLNCPSDR